MMNEPNVRVIVKTSDYQEWCVTQSTAVSDVLLDCALAGPFAAEYQVHCREATAEEKSDHCCSYCCRAEWDFAEIKHFAKTGELRCFENDKYCATSGSTILPDGQCPELTLYEAKRIILDNQVLEEYPDELVARGVAIE